MSCALLQHCMGIFFYAVKWDNSIVMVHMLHETNPKLDCIFAISKIVNKGVPEVTRFVLFVNVAPME